MTWLKGKKAKLGSNPIRHGAHHGILDDMLFEYVHEFVCDPLYDSVISVEDGLEINVGIYYDLA